MNEKRMQVSRTTVVPPPQQPPTIETARKAILTFAKQRRLSVNDKEMAFVATGKFTLAHAPVSGIERYTPEDFTKGVVIQVVTISTSLASKLPSGTYAVKAQFRPGATQGKVTFLAENGNVAAEGHLIVRGRQEAAVWFPDVYGDPIAEIPVITSTHVWIGNQSHVGDLNYGHWGVDCAGWQPYRVLYYWA